MADIGKDPQGIKLGGRRLRQRVGMHIYVLPNLMTTGNLFFGFFAIIQSIKGEYLQAAYAIVAAAIFDQLDGRVARLTRTVSQFGAEYDSLCDLVSFGAAPGILLFLWALQPSRTSRLVGEFHVLRVRCFALSAVQRSSQRARKSLLPRAPHSDGRRHRRQLGLVLH